MQVIWILDDIGNAEQLVARNGSGVNSLADLKGKKVATPFVSTAHYQLLVALTDAGVNPKEVQILNMRPPEIAAAWERGDIDATFIWDPVLSQGEGQRQGDHLLGRASPRRARPTFDAIMVNKALGREEQGFRDRAGRRRSPSRTRPTRPTRPSGRPTARR